MDFIITDSDIIVEMIAPNVYRIRIKNEILDGLSCPHCGAKLVRNGFYKRIVTNLDTKNKVVVILYLPRLKCCNHDCRYKLEHQLKSAVTFKIRPTFIQKYSRHLVCDLIALLCYREPSLDEHDQFKELVTSIEQKQGQDIYLLSYMQKSNPFLRLYYHRKPNFF